MPPRILQRLQRTGGRLLTSPLAFLIAGVIDVCAYWFGALCRALGAKRLP